MMTACAPTAHGPPNSKRVRQGDHRSGGLAEGHALFECGSPCLSGALPSAAPRDAPGANVVPFNDVCKSISKSGMGP